MFLFQQSGFPFQGYKMDDLPSVYSSETLSYVDDSHVDIVSGYPVARDDSSYWVMVVVRPPVTSDLCTLGDQTSRRKRETDEGNFSYTWELLKILTI